MRMLVIKKSKLIKAILLTTFALAFSAAQANPHIHGTRTHTHPLPTQGVKHKHGASAVGRHAGNAPAKQAQTNTRPLQQQRLAKRVTPKQGNANSELQNAYKRKDYKSVYRIASTYAKRGDPAAEFVLGELFLLGHGQKKNPKTALNWFKKSADKGHPGSQFRLASLYTSGIEMQV